MVAKIVTAPASDRDVVAATKEALRRAVLTLVAVPDPDRRYLTVVTPTMHVVRDAAEAYGWTPEIVSFRPTPRDVQIYLEVLGWLAWYGRTHDETVVQLFLAWSTGAEWWRLTRRFAASERTLRRWLDDMCRVIHRQFAPAFRKLFLLDAWPDCPAKSDSPIYSADAVPEIAEPLPKSPTSWIADGERPSLDTSIPAVAAERQKLIARLQRQGRRRRRRRRRHRKNDQPPSASS